MLITSALETGDEKSGSCSAQYGLDDFRGAHALCGAAVCRVSVTVTRAVRTDRTILLHSPWA